MSRLCDMVTALSFCISDVANGGRFGNKAAGAGHAPCLGLPTIDARHVSCGAQIVRLRREIDADPARPQLIVTERGAS